MYRRTMEPFKGYPADELFVEIPTGSSAPDIGRRLVEAGVVRDLLTFRVTLWRAGQARSLRAGEYRFDRPMTAVEVIEKISRGEVYERRVTFPEGLIIPEMAALYEARGLGAADLLREGSKEPVARGQVRSEGTGISKDTCSPRPIRCHGAHLRNV